MSDRLRFGIFMAVSDSPIQVSTGRWHETLLRYRLEGLPIIDAGLDEPVLGLLGSPENCLLALSVMREFRE